MRFPTMATDGVHRPIIPVLIESPAGKQLVVDALVDTGSDVTLFPEAFAAALDISLHGQPSRPVASALGIVAHYRPSQLLLELRRAPDEILRWTATVGFVARRMAYGILGTRGMFEFFELTYSAANRVLELDPHNSLPT